MTIHVNNQSAGGGGGAPTDATYIVQTPDGTLTNEQAISALSTGYLKGATTTGIITSQAVPIPIADGGTNATSFATSTGITYYTGTALATIAEMTWDATNKILTNSHATLNPGIVATSSSGLPYLSVAVTGSAWKWTLPASNTSMIFTYNDTETLRLLTTGDILTIGTVATTGRLRVPNNTMIGWRNAANSGNLTAGFNGSDIFAISGATTITGTLIATTLNLTNPLGVIYGGTGLASYTENNLLYASGTTTIAGLATANSGVLVTSGAGVPSIATDIPTAVTIGGAYSYRVGGTDVSVADGGTGASTDSGARTNLGVAIGSNVQAWDATLDAFAAYNTNGLITQTAANTFTGRTLTGPAAGISVANGDGVAGNPTLSLANDLAAVEGLATTGMAARTAASTWTTRTITAGTGISVADGDGVSGNPTITSTVVSNMQIFTADDTWTKPAGVTLVYVECIGAGGGGGGGFGAAAGSERNGGGGGGGGGIFRKMFRASELGATVTVTVGAAGPGGAAAANGTGGESSLFGTHMTAFGGGGGAAATSTNGGGGGAGAGLIAVGGDSTSSTGGTGGGPGGSTPGNDNAAFGGGGGGSSNSPTPTTPAGNAIMVGAGGGTASNNGTTDGTAGGSSFISCGGGGGGGGVNAATPGTERAGGAGGASNSYVLGGGGTAGVAGGATPGGTGVMYQGGGGGGSNNDGTAGAGGDGGIGGGGGGGGGGTSTGGAGGNGGAGQVRVLSW